MQSDYFGAAAESENGRVRARPDSPRPRPGAQNTEARLDSPPTTTTTTSKDDADADHADDSGGPVPTVPLYLPPAPPATRDSNTSGVTRGDVSIPRCQPHRTCLSLSILVPSSCFHPLFFLSLHLSNRPVTAVTYRRDIRPFVCDCGKGFSEGMHLGLICSFPCIVGSNSI